MHLYAAFDSTLDTAKANSRLADATRTGNISAGTLPVDAVTLTHQAFGGALTILVAGATLLVVAQMVSHCYPWSPPYQRDHLPFRVGVGSG